MTRPPIPIPPDSPEKVRQDAHVLLASVRSTLADLLAEVAEGGGTSLRDLGLKQSELESALKRAFEAEGKYNDWKDKADQGAADRLGPLGEIDFDALRHDIACRLARLRECCRET